MTFAQKGLNSLNSICSICLEMEAISKWIHFGLSPHLFSAQSSQD